MVPHRATGSGCCRKRPDQCLASSLEECRRTTVKDTKIFVYFVCLLSCSQVYPSLVVKLRVKHVQVKGKFPLTCQETARKIYKNNYINQKSSTAIFNKNTYTTCPVFHQIWYLNHGTIAEAGVQTAVVSCWGGDHPVTQGEGQTSLGWDTAGIWRKWMKNDDW